MWGGDGGIGGGDGGAVPLSQMAIAAAPQG